MIAKLYINAVKSFPQKKQFCPSPSGCCSGRFWPVSECAGLWGCSWSISGPSPASAIVYRTPCCSASCPAEVAFLWANRLFSICPAPSGYSLELLLRCALSQLRPAAVRTAVPPSVFVTVRFAPARRGPLAGASAPRPPECSAEASRLSWVSPPQDPAPGLGLTQGSLPALGSSWRQRGGVLSTKQSRPFAEHSRGLLHRAGCLS